MNTVTPDDRWADDKVQFARLLCEIVANVEDIRPGDLCMSMDISEEELEELFERAHDVWEASKASIR